MRAASLALALLLAAAPAGVARADSKDAAQTYLLAASRLYENLEYERALEQVRRARTVTTGVADDAAIARYEGVILFDLGKRDEALAAFRESLYLEPDARLPLKVSPKIAEAFEATREAVRKELAPILAKRKAEEEAKRAAEEAARHEAEERVRLASEAVAKAEAARAEAAAREVALRAEADAARKKAEEARAQQLADLQRREEEAKRAEAALSEARRKLELEAHLAEERRRAEAEAEAARRALGDRPVERDLVPRTTRPESPPLVVKERPAPVAPIIFGSLTAAAGGVAATFAVLARQSLDAARAAQFQSDTITDLERARGHALVANIAFGVAGTAALATLISAIAHAGSAPPPPPPALETVP